MSSEKFKEDCDWIKLFLAPKGALEVHLSSVSLSVSLSVCLSVIPHYALKLFKALLKLASQGQLVRAS